MSSIEHFAKLWKLIDTARANKIAKPSLRLGNYLFKAAARPDTIYVTDQAAYEDRRYFGNISRGAFTPISCNKDEILEILALAGDPGTAAKAFGRKTGMCCVCGRALINKESVRLMIGPICLEKYGFSPMELIDAADEDGQLTFADI